MKVGKYHELDIIGVPVSQAIDELQAFLACNDDVIIHTEDDGDFPRVYVYRLVEETPAEEAGRLARERMQFKTLEERERLQYEQLKAKYEQV